MLTAIVSTIEAAEASQRAARSLTRGDETRAWQSAMARSMQRYNEGTATVISYAREGAPKSPACSARPARQMSQSALRCEFELFSCCVSC